MSEWQRVTIALAVGAVVVGGAMGFKSMQAAEPTPAPAPDVPSYICHATIGRAVVAQTCAPEYHN